MRDESACAMEKGLEFRAPHPYMWHWSEGARITAINGVVLSKLMTASEHRTAVSLQFKSSLSESGRRLLFTRCMIENGTRRPGPWS